MTTPTTANSMTDAAFLALAPSCASASTMTSKSAYRASIAMVRARRALDVDDARALAFKSIALARLRSCIASFVDEHRLEVRALASEFMSELIDGRSVTMTEALDALRDAGAFDAGANEKFMASAFDAVRLARSRGEGTQKDDDFIASQCARAERSASKEVRESAKACAKATETRATGNASSANAMTTDEGRACTREVSTSAVDGLVPPPPERISTAVEIRRAMAACARDLNPDVDWLRRITAMVRMEAIALGGGGIHFEEAFSSSLAHAQEGISAQVVDRRSAVVKQASHLLVALARHAAAAFEPFVEHFIMTLLRTTVITVGVIAESGDLGIRGIIANCQSPRVVAKLSAACLAERAPKMRASIIEYLSLILQTWDLSKKHLDCISDALRATLTDADATVRCNSKACFEILNATSPTSSRDLLTRVDSKLSGSLQDLLSVDSGSEELSERRGRDARAIEHSSRERSSSRSTPVGVVRRLGVASRVAQVPIESVPVVAPPQNVSKFDAPAPPPRPERDVFTAIEFAEQIERAGNRTGRVEASARLRDALDEADTRAHGARASRFEAQAKKRVGKIAKLLAAYMSDTNGLVLDAALESISTLAHIACEDLRTSLPELCLGVFECLIDNREATRSLAAEALASIGDLYEPNALVPALLHALIQASTARAKTGVLEFALYVLSGLGSGTDQVAHNPASVSSTLEKWVDTVLAMACDVDETMSKAAAANLAAVHSHVDGAVIPRRLCECTHATRVMFFKALERRAPKFADALRPLVDLEKPSSPPRVEPKVMRTPAPLPRLVAASAKASIAISPPRLPPPTTDYDSLDDDDEFEDQNIASLNRSYETMYIEASASKPAGKPRTAEDSNQGDIAQRVVEALEGMRNDHSEAIVKGLLAIASAASSDAEQFKMYLALASPRLCAALDDSRPIVAAYAMYAMRRIFVETKNIIARDAFTALAPLLNATDKSVVAPLTCVQLVVERSSRSDLESALPLILRAIANACDSDEISVRQLAFRVFGLSQAALGAAWMAPYVETMPPLHREMVEHFAKR